MARQGVQPRAGLPELEQGDGQKHKLLQIGIAVQAQPDLYLHRPPLHLTQCVQPDRLQHINLESTFERRG